MSVSGHKSVQSLATYQKTRDKQKIEMSEGLFQSMTWKEDQFNIQSHKPFRTIVPKEQTSTTQVQQKLLPAPPETTKKVVQNKENTVQELVPFEANFDDDLLSVLTDIEGNNPPEKREQIAVTATSNTQNIVTNIPKSFFSNCTIGNIHFHINK